MYARYAVQRTYALCAMYTMRRLHQLSTWYTIYTLYTVCTMYTMYTLFALYTSYTLYTCRHLFILHTAPEQSSRLEMWRRRLHITFGNFSVPYKSCKCIHHQTNTCLCYSECPNSLQIFRDRICFASEACFADARPPK